jgi:4'-phosphopantetheinyl transferase
VWCLGTNTRTAVETAIDLGMLSPDERARHDRLAFARDRRDFAAAHALLRQSLSQVARRPPDEWRFTAEQFVKPRLAADQAASTDLTFNLSHARGLVACAIARHVDVGIDVEAVDRVRDALDLASRFFSAEETRELERTPPEARATRFAELWTLKEAFAKCIGLGLAMPLSSTSFDLSHARSVRFRPPPDLSGAGWQFAVFLPTPSYVLAVAVRVEARGGADLPWAPRFQARWASPDDRPGLLPHRLSA